MSTTVKKALQVLEALSKSPGTVGIIQIGRQLNLNKSTAYRLVDTLRSNGYAYQDPVTGHYGLTTKLWELGSSVVQRLDLRDIAKPTLEHCVAETGETTLLGILKDDSVLILDKVASQQPLQLSSPVGTRVDLQSSSIGRAVLAFQSHDLIERVIPKMSKRTEHTIATRKALLDELEQIRKRGTAICVDEWYVGVSGVAAPIHNLDGQVVAAVCISGPTARLPLKQLKKFEPIVRKAAEDISHLQGYRQPAA